MEVIVFKDIDGVTSSVRNAILKQPYDALSIQLIADAFRIAKEKYGFDVKLVISSTRRKDHNHGSAELIARRMEEVLGGKKCPFEFHQMYRTVTYTSREGVTEELERLSYDFPDISDYHHVWGEDLEISHTEHWRGWEIMDWLVTDENINRPYIVLDDSFDLYPIHCSDILRIDNGEETGFMINHYDRLLSMFDRLAEKFNVDPISN